jgi:hypothetical protein
MSNEFPPGWDEERVRQVLAHYEGQTDEEAAAEDEEAFESDEYTVMAVPTELVPTIRALIGQHEERTGIEGSRQRS